MKKNEVPQDESCLSKVNIKEVVYAVDEQGNRAATHLPGGS